MLLDGKVVVITGGSRGLGHSMALGFAGCGANLAIASRKLDSCEETVKEIQSIGRKASAHAIHVGKWDAWPMMKAGAETASAPARRSAPRRD